MWRFLHIASMFGAVTLGVGGILFRNAVVRSGDVAAIRQALAVERRLAHLVATPLFIAGIAFGFVTAVTIGFDLTAPWLVTAYVLVGVIVVNSLVLDEPYVRRLQTAIASNGDDEPSAALTSLTESSRPQVASIIDVSLWIAVIYTMVMKPFS
jgi:uncharacterized membrane protein